MSICKRTPKADSGKPPVVTLHPVSETLSAEQDTATVARNFVTDTEMVHDRMKGLPPLARSNLDSCKTNKGQSARAVPYPRGCFP
jgi:hypothetical protein